MNEGTNNIISIELPYFDRKALLEIEGNNLENIFIKYANYEKKEILEQILKNNYKYTLAVSNSFGRCDSCTATLVLDLYYKKI